MGATGDAIGLFVNSSKDGKKWSDPVVAHAAATGDSPQNGSLACDDAPASAGYGTCYLAYNNAGSTPANALVDRQSTDGGATWSAPAAPSDASVGTGAVTLVQPPPPGAAPGSTCGRVVVAFNNGTTHQCDLLQRLRRHLVGALGRHVHARGDAHGRPGCAHLARRLRLDRRRRRRLPRLADAQLPHCTDDPLGRGSAGATNIKVACVTGMVAGNTLTVDASARARRR